MTLESAANIVQPLLLKQRKPLATFVEKLAPFAHNPLFNCRRDSSLKHRMELVKLVLTKFYRQNLTKSAVSLTELHRQRKDIQQKPSSKKVIEL